MGACCATQSESDVRDIPLSQALTAKSQGSVSKGLHYKIKAITGRSPPPLRAHTLVLHDTNLYVFGGVSNSQDMIDEQAHSRKSVNVFSNDTVRFWIGSQRWEPLLIRGLVPPARCAHTSVVYHGAMYILGTELYDSADLFQLNLHSFHWRCVPATGDSPPAMAGQSAVVYHDVMIVFGGEVNLTTTNTIYIYNFQGHKWAQHVPMPADFEPQCRRDHTAVVHGNAMIVFGGFGRVDPVDETLVSFNPETTKWQKVRQVGERPAARGGHIAETYQNYMIIHGGMGCGGTVFSDTYMLHIETGTWRKLGTGPKLCFHASAIFDERIYLFGGNDGINNSSETNILPLKTVVAESAHAPLADIIVDDGPTALGGPQALRPVRDPNDVPPPKVQPQEPPKKAVEQHRPTPLPVAEPLPIAVPVTEPADEEEIILVPDSPRAGNKAQATAVEAPPPEEEEPFMFSFAKEERTAESEDVALARPAQNAGQGKVTEIEPASPKPPTPVETPIDVVLQPEGTSFGVDTPRQAPEEEPKAARDDNGEFGFAPAIPPPTTRKDSLEVSDDEGFGNIRTHNKDSREATPTMDDFLQGNSDRRKSEQDPEVAVAVQSTRKSVDRDDEFGDNGPKQASNANERDDSPEYINRPSTADNDTAPVDDSYGNNDYGDSTAPATKANNDDEYGNNDYVDNTANDGYGNNDYTDNTTPAHEGDGNNDDGDNTANDGYGNNDNTTPAHDGYGNNDDVDNTANDGYGNNDYTDNTAADDQYGNNAGYEDNAPADDGAYGDNTAPADAGYGDYDNAQAEPAADGFGGGDEGFGDFGGNDFGDNAPADGGFGGDEGFGDFGGNDFGDNAPADGGFGGDEGFGDFGGNDFGNNADPADGGEGGFGGDEGFGDLGGFDNNDAGFGDLGGDEGFGDVGGFDDKANDGFGAPEGGNGGGADDFAFDDTAFEF